MDSTSIISIVFAAVELLLKIIERGDDTEGRCLEAINQIAEDTRRRVDALARIKWD